MRRRVLLGAGAGAALGLLGRSPKGRAAPSDGAIDEASAQKAVANSATSSASSSATNSAPNPAAPPHYVEYPPVRPGISFRFPRDHGAHPDYRTEWWYVTGILEASPAQTLGFQVTFFRSRLDTDPANPSAFAPHQLLFAHAAVSDPVLGHLISEQRAARAGFGLAEASEADMKISIGDWSLVRDQASGRFAIEVPGRDIALSLALESTQPVLAEGEAGYSRKGPAAGEASAYYSLPHLATRGTLDLRGARRAVSGEAWMDREWSSTYLGPEARGWDWTGVNLEDGSALMAFRIRSTAGEALWAAATLRRENGSVELFGPGEVHFATESMWRSSRSGVTYPVSQKVSVGPYAWQLVPLMDDQELDSSASTGTIYWEGAVRATAIGPAAAAIGAGHGYLELTGYDQALTL